MAVAVLTVTNTALLQGNTQTNVKQQAPGKARTVMRYADCVPGAASSLRSSKYIRTSFSAASRVTCGLMDRAYRIYLHAKV